VDFGFPPDFFSERKVDFVACDMPSANAFMINVYAAVAQEERRMISDRTKRDRRALWSEHWPLRRFSRSWLECPPAPRLQS
jgi:hypothetical protein